jgi:ribosomal protein L40E
MTEILTESFCERCGTRYTFQTTAPRRARMGKLKVLSKGITNWVQSDESSLEEALADARSEAERAVSTSQLEAFHETFNFCMSCRQYTCSNCWNGPENQCLTCSPDLSREILPAPFPELEPHAPLVYGSTQLVEHVSGTDAAEPGPEAWPEVDIGRLAAVMGATNGDVEHLAGAPAVEAEDQAAAPEAIGETSEAIGETPEAPAHEAPFRPLVAPRSSVAASHDEEQAAQAAEDAAAAAALAAAMRPEEPATALQPAATTAEPEPITEAAAPTAEAPAAAAAAAVEPEPITEAAEPTAEAPVTGAPPAPSPTDERAAAAAAQTAAMLRKFRPGQSIDAELEAFERESAAASAVAASATAATEPVVAQEPEPEPVLAAETESAPVPVAAEPEPEPEPVLAAEPETEPVPVAAEPEAEPVLAAEPEPEPVLASAPEPEPAAAQPEPAAAQPEPEGPPPARRDDRVEVPTWRIVAPDGGADQVPTPSSPSMPPVQPGAPQWPQAQATPPEWPQAPQNGSAQWPSAAAFIAAAQNPVVRAQAALWAASSAEVTANPGGVQSCTSCGLSLSATARFCRRCGTRQG